MDSLKRLLGPAPSELPVNDLLANLVPERNRIRRNLLWFQSEEGKIRQKELMKAQRKGKATKQAKRVASKSKTSRKQLMNLNAKDVEAALAKLRKQKGLTK